MLIPFLPKSILAIHLLSIDTSHCQAAVAQQALYVKQIQ